MPSTTRTTLAPRTLCDAAAVTAVEDDDEDVLVRSLVRSSSAADDEVGAAAQGEEDTEGGKAAEVDGVDESGSDSDDDMIYQVERIIDSRPSVDKGVELLEYRVRWEGYAAADDTWEPSANILDKTLVTKFDEVGERARAPNSVTTS
jgi:hypothetical protein